MKPHKAKALTGRVGCGNAPERNRQVERFRQETAENRPGAAPIRPGDSVIIEKSGFEFFQTNRVEPRITRRVFVPCSFLSEAAGDFSYAETGGSGGAERGKRRF